VSACPPGLASLDLLEDAGPAVCEEMGCDVGGGGEVVGEGEDGGEGEGEGVAEEGDDVAEVEGCRLWTKGFQDLRGRAGITSLWRAEIWVIDLKELVRFKFTWIAGLAPDWIRYRMLTPAWYDASSDN
jgi:hypothetical protein